MDKTDTMDNENSPDALSKAEGEEVLSVLAARLTWKMVDERFVASTGKSEGYIVRHFNSDPSKPCIVEYCLSVFGTWNKLRNKGQNTLKQFDSSALAKAACERHDATGRWE